MCGIVGFTHIKGSENDNLIRATTALLIHRGPDQQGCFESESVSLGAARLKILDLEGGDQPIKSANGDVVIVFNGEIYNHLELRKELEQRGHRFRSHSDTETVLEAYLEWGTACFARLRGMFAVALWTESQKRLILARDRVGIKPLYLARVGEDLVFGSEMKTILAHPRIDRHLDLTALDCYLSLNYTPCPLTLIKGIEKLSPGHWLEWKNGSIRTESFWHLRSQTDEQWTMASATERLDTLLRDSAKEHLLSDVPLGIWLSGGIDSSTVLHYAASVSSSPLSTFSITFEGREFDDGPYSRRVAAHYGARHEEMDLTDHLGLEEAIEEFAYYADDPNADAGALPVWFLSKLAKQNVTVALSGEGADELFGGYLTYRADDLARQFRVLGRPFLALTAKLARKWPASDEKISFEYKLQRFLEGCQLSAARAHVFWNGTFSEREKRELTRGQLHGGLETILSEITQAGGGLKSLMRFDQKYFLADDILAKVDRISMAHSLEVRPIFLDHRLIEFASSLPTNLLLQGSRQKVILRKLMEGKLPAEVLTRKKVGFDIPAHQWLRGRLRDFMIEVLKDGSAKYSSLFEESYIDRCIEQHVQRTRNLGYHLWGLLILFLWMRRWNVELPGSQPEFRLHDEALSLA